jgi:hypothetical protein
MSFVYVSRLATVQTRTYYMFSVVLEYGVQCTVQMCLHVEQLFNYGHRSDANSARNSSNRIVSRRRRIQSSVPVGPVVVGRPLQENSIVDDQVRPERDTQHRLLRILFLLNQLIERPEALFQSNCTLSLLLSVSISSSHQLEGLISIIHTKSIFHSAAYIPLSLYLYF